MSVPQAKFREFVFQVLYSRDLGAPDDQELIETVMELVSINRKTVELALEKARLIESQLKEIDALIQKTSVAYDFDRIKSVERNILRLSVYEIVFDEKIPPKVAIAEGVRLTRKFSTSEAACFVNALLDKIYRRMEGLEGSDQDLDLEQQARALKNSEEASDEVKSRWEARFSGSDKEDM